MVGARQASKWRAFQREMPSKKIPLNCHLKAGAQREGLGRQIFTARVDSMGGKNLSGTLAPAM